MRVVCWIVRLSEDRRRFGYFVHTVVIYDCLSNDRLDYGRVILKILFDLEDEQRTVEMPRKILNKRQVGRCGWVMEEQSLTPRGAVMQDRSSLFLVRAGLLD